MILLGLSFSLISLANKPPHSEDELLNFNFVTWLTEGDGAHQAVKDRDMERLKKMLRAGIYLGTKNKEGRTPLHLAVLLKNLEAVEILIRSGAHINAQDNKGNTALHFAIKHSQEAIISTLLEWRASSNFGDYQGNTALHWAIKLEDIDTAKQLLNHGADPNIPNKWGDSPLHFAILESQPEFVELFLQYDITKINFKDSNGNTPLHLVGYLKDSAEIKISKLLLDNGADPRIENNVGKSVVEYLQDSLFFPDSATVSFIQLYRP